MVGREVITPARPMVVRCLHPTAELLMKDTSLHKNIDFATSSITLIFSYELQLRLGK